MSSTVMYYPVSMARNDPQMNLRFPAELKGQIEEAAKSNGRSMNAEIVARLEASFTAKLEQKYVVADELENMLNKQGIQLLKEVADLINQRIPGKK